MHIPTYWAQARLRHESRPTHGITVQRWGWSDTSQEAAQAHAQERAAKALQDARHAALPQASRAWNGRTSTRSTASAPHTRRSPAAARRHGDDTQQLRRPLPEHRARGHRRYRPARAAERCALSRRDPAFAGFGRHLAGPAGTAQEQFEDGGHGAGRAAAVPGHAARAALVGGAAGAPARGHGLAARTRHGARAGLPPKPCRLGLRVYETPKGLRVIVTHTDFAPDDPAVAQLFDALQVDPLYALLCERQQCFRARVSGKPWRMGLTGLSTSLRRWPQPEQTRQERRQWALAYDEKPRALQLAGCCSNWATHACVRPPTPLCNGTTKPAGPARTCPWPEESRASTIAHEYNDRLTLAPPPCRVLRSP